MGERIIVCCCRLGCAWFFFLLLQLSAIGIAVASIFVKDWVSRGTFTSGVYECSDSACIEKNYVDQAKYWCDTKNDDSMCKLFTGLSLGMYAYLICVSAGVVFTLLWVFNSFCFMCRKNCFGCGFIFALLSMAAQVAGVVSYAILANVKFTDCEAATAEGDQPTLCAEVGYELAIAAAADFILLLFFYLICGCSTRSKLQKVSRNDPKHIELQNQSIDVANNHTNPAGKKAWGKN